MLYSTSQAAKAAGISPATIRNLTSGVFSAHYAGLFSPGAAPGKGAARVLTEDDVKLLGYISTRTAAGRSHAEVGAEVRAGALAGFTWPPEEGASSEEAEAPAADRQGQSPPEGPTALVVLGQFAEAMRIEFAAARQREADLQQALVDAERRAAAAEAQLAALRATQRRGFWRRLLGG